MENLLKQSAKVLTSKEKELKKYVNNLAKVNPDVKKGMDMLVKGAKQAGKFASESFEYVKIEGEIASLNAKIATSEYNIGKLVAEKDAKLTSAEVKKEIDNVKSYKSKITALKAKEKKIGKKSK